MIYTVKNNKLLIMFRTSLTSSYCSGKISPDSSVLTYTKTLSPPTRLACSRCRKICWPTGTGKAAGAAALTHTLLLLVIFLVLVIVSFAGLLDAICTHLGHILGAELRHLGECVD